jgi:ATP-dependent Clp protease protease subunit
MVDMKYLDPLRLNDEEEEQPKEDKQEQSPYLMKKMEQLFLKKRAVYLWGPVEDKSARDIVSKLLLLDADKPGQEIKFYINSPGGVVTSGMVIYDTMRMIQSPVITICMGLAASMGSILLSGGIKGQTSHFSARRSDDPPAEHWWLFPGSKRGYRNTR